MARRITIRFSDEEEAAVLGFKKGDSAWSRLPFGSKVVAMIVELVRTEAAIAAVVELEGLAALLQGRADNDIAQETGLSPERVAQIRGGDLLCDRELLEIARLLQVPTEELLPYRKAVQGEAPSSDPNTTTEKEGNGHHDYHHG